MPSRTFKEPVKFWAAGVTGLSTRDNPQRILIGPPAQPERWGSGAIPHDCLKDTITGRGVANGLDSVMVRWGGGGDTQAQESLLTFKAYEQGREKWQGETLEGVWFDEEPPHIYSEGKTRTQARSGIVIVTFTPLRGMSDVVRLFLSESDLQELRRIGRE
jgi:phage terminase large subunit-like protein